MYAFIQHPSPVQPYDSLLQLLVAQVVLEEHLLDIVLESLHGVHLAAAFVLHLVGSLAQTFLSHTQIINNQHQVLIDPVEVFLLTSHLIGLLVELLDDHFLGTDVSLQLLNLIVKNELEFLQLLNLLLELADLDVLLLDGG